MFVALVMAASLVSAVAAADGEAPWFGTWRLDPETSTARAAPSPYTRVTLRIEPSGVDGLRVIYDMVGTRGGVTHREWTGRFDGRDYPMQGVDYVMTNAYRRLDDRRYEIVVKVDGRHAATAVVSVSPDGDTLTVDTEERGPGGNIVESRAVYDRIR